MKITGTGPKPPAGAAEGPAKAGQTSGKTFAGAIDQAAPGTTAGAAPASTAGMADIGAELSAGRISRETAINKVVDRVLDRQVGASAPASIREQVGAALRQALQDDPLLASKLSALDG